MGIVGLGHIGCKVAEIAHAMGMDISAATSKNSSDLPECIRKVTMEGLFSTSDIITLHCPLTAENHHMINAKTLAMMRPGTILINTGRGGLIDEEAVAAALESGHLRAYCADVMEQEPPRADNPLLRQPHAYITPHVAWATREARKRLMDICVENIKRFMAGEPQNEV
jgi:glycerate dehydrogenase